jgi:hypothetical protein
MPLTIAESYRPGAIGAITQMHARYYSAHWGFGPFFEAMVASILLSIRSYGINILMGFHVWVPSQFSCLCLVEF